MTQQEIASIIECDLSNKNKTNTILFHSTLLACIIVFVTGLTIAVANHNKLISNLLWLLLLTTAYPVINLIKTNNRQALLTILASTAFGAIICITLLFTPTDLFKDLPVFSLCLMLITIALVAGIITIVLKEPAPKKSELRVFCGIITLSYLATLSIMVFIYFKETTKTFAGIIPVIMLTIALFGFIFAEKQLNLDSKYLTYTATFSALSVIFKIMGNAISNTFAIFGPLFRFTLVYIPWVTSGIVLGPIGGMVATGIGDFLGQTLLPAGGSWYWMTWLSNVLFALFPALIYKYLPLKKGLEWLKVLIGVAISAVVCTLGVGTYALATLYGNPFITVLLPRFFQLIPIAINYALIVALLPALKHAKIKPTPVQLHQINNPTPTTIPVPNG